MGSYPEERYRERGKEHIIAFYGPAADRVDREKTLRMCRFITQIETDFFHGAPYDTYVWHFVVSEGRDLAGGTEHASSTEMHLTTEEGPYALQGMAHRDPPGFELWLRARKPLFDTALFRATGLCSPVSLSSPSRARPTVRPRLVEPTAPAKALNGKSGQKPASNGADMPTDRTSEAVQPRHEAPAAAVAQPAAAESGRSAPLATRKPVAARQIPLGRWPRNRPSHCPPVRTRRPNNRAGKTRVSFRISRSPARKISGRSRNWR